jgi:ABC-type transport system involved in multi-copper enzyme maturation permease subunit
LFDKCRDSLKEFKRRNEWARGTEFFSGNLDMRLGPGPVFAYEWLTATRRWQVYALRALFVGVILVGMVIVWHNTRRFADTGPTVSFQQLASYGQTLYETVVSIELTLVLLAATATTAGAICLDKARGTLDHMLATDLSNAEIVLGKLGARLVPVLGLIACVLPIMALSSLLGGIDPEAIFGSFLTATGCALLSSSLALTLSVWGRKTHEVLMLAYLILILWLIGPALVIYIMQHFFGSTPLLQLANIAWVSNPYYLVFAPYVGPGNKAGWVTYLAFLGVCLGLSTVLVGLAIGRIRVVAMTQAGQPASRSRRRRFAFHLARPAWLPHIPGPSLDGNPVLWREWHRSKPTGLLGLVWFLYTGLGILWIALTLWSVRSVNRGPETIAILSAFQVSVGLLLLSVSAATSLAEERVRGSLDVLLTTPLSTRTILVGKWLGTFRQSGRVVVWPAAMGGLVVVGSGLWIGYFLLLGLILAYIAVITSLGLALATWVSRLGRAVALCVSAYAVFAIGWMSLVMLMFRPDPLGLSLILGSPIYGTGLATAAVVAPGGMRFDTSERQIVIATFLWILIHSGIAALLFAATLAVFDRCLGRVSETSRRPAPRAKQKPVALLEPDY